MAFSCHGLSDDPMSLGGFLVVDLWALACSSRIWLSQSLNPFPRFSHAACGLHTPNFSSHQEHSKVTATGSWESHLRHISHHCSLSCECLRFLDRKVLAVGLLHLRAAPAAHRMHHSDVRVEVRVVLRDPRSVPTMLRLGIPSTLPERANRILPVLSHQSPMFAFVRYQRSDFVDGRP